jgi:hypothetical protein
MTDFIFSVPWWVIVPLLAVGAGILVYNDRQLNRRGELIGLAILTVTILWAVIRTASSACSPLAPRPGRGVATRSAMAPSITRK